MIKVELNDRGKARIVGISGEVDLYSSPEVRRVLLELTAENAPTIVVNLEAVTYMDSSGLATLIEGLQQVEKYGGRFILSGLRKEVKDVFDLSRLDQVFEICPSVDEAVNRAGGDGTRQ